MNRIAQALLYALFAAGLGYFSLSPAYQYSDANKASIKVSFSHAATRVEECVKLTPQEINDRALAGEPISECERERLPIRLELEIDGAVVYYVDAEPSGLWNDGPAAVYLRFDIDPGKLPKDSVIINRPFSFYEEFREQILMAGALFALLTGREIPDVLS